MATTTFIINFPYGDTVKCGFEGSGKWGIDHPTNWYGDSEVIEPDILFWREMADQGVETVRCEATGSEWSVSQEIAEWQMERNER